MKTALTETQRECDWDKELATVVNMVQGGTFSVGETIIHEGYAVVLLKNSASPDRICLVKVPEGWCVLASISI